MVNISSGWRRKFEQILSWLYPASLYSLPASHDIVDVKMAGPGMRYYEIARAMQGAWGCHPGDPNPPERIQAALAQPSHLPGQEAEGESRPKLFHFASYAFDQQTSIHDLVGDHDIVLVSSFLIDKFPFLAGPLGKNRSLSSNSTIPSSWKTCTIISTSRCRSRKA